MIFFHRVRADPGPTLARPDWPAESGPALRARVKGQEKWVGPGLARPLDSVRSAHLQKLRLQRGSQSQIQQQLPGRTQISQSGLV